MAAAPVTSEEEEKKTEPSAQAPADGGEPAAGPLPTAPAPVTSTQSVSTAPDSIQIAQRPAPEMGMSVTTPGQEPLSKTSAAMGSETKDAAGNVTATTSKPGVTTTSPGVKPKTTDASAKTKSATPADTGNSREAQTQFIKNFMDLYAKMAEGKDPVAAAEWNSYIQMQSPKNQIAMEAMAMRLRQEGNDGPGAGSALLAMMQRDMDFADDQVLSQINARSAARLHQMNTWGIEKAMEMVKEEKNQARNDFWDAVKAGQWDLAQTLGSTLFGVSIDVQALKAADPATQELVGNAMNSMNQLISQGKADEAKAVAEQIARTNPEAFGFSTPEEALAVVSQMDFKYEAWANLQERSNATLVAARNAALSEDWAGFNSAIDNWANNQLPGAVDGMGHGIIKSATLEEINKYREAAGKTPVTEAERSSLDATEIAKDRQAFNIKNASKSMNAVDIALDNLTDAIPELKKNPKAYAAARRWIAEQQAGYSSSPTPPWDPSSQTVHYYSDWPKVYWDSAGVQTTINGEFEIDENSGAGLRDLTTEDGKRQESLDKAYNNYLTNTPPAERLSAKDWFYATKGGSTKVQAGYKTTTPGAGGTAGTLSEERQNIIDSLQPSQRPPEGASFVLRAGANGGWPMSLLKYMPELTEWTTDTKVMYWNPDTGKYSTTKNDAYRALYSEG